MASDIGILNNIQEVSGIINFCSTELHEPIEVSMGCEARVQRRWRPGAFCSVSTGDSDILSSCDMKDELAFKTLQGNPAFFLSQGISRSISLKPENTGSLSHTHF